MTSALPSFDGRYRVALAGGMMLGQLPQPSSPGLSQHPEGPPPPPMSRALMVCCPHCALTDGLTVSWEHPKQQDVGAEEFESGPVAAPEDRWVAVRVQCPYGHHWHDILPESYLVQLSESLGAQRPLGPE